MEILEARSDNWGIESGLVSCEWFNVTEISEELSTIDEFEDKVEVSGVLGESFEIDNEGMVDLRVDKVFVVDVIDLLCLHDFMLVE